MFQNWIVFLAAFAYIGILFLVASYGDRRRTMPRGKPRLLIYPLSLAVYCTSWTYFGSVGLATRTGFEFLAIYIGPILMLVFCTPLLIRVIRLAKAQNSTSIADFIAARYGKSQPLAATVALIALIGTIPYIALQLKAVSLSLETVLQGSGFDGRGNAYFNDLALVVALAMTAFAILFGTRHTDATEHQDGLMLAIASESIVKLAAFLTVGAFVLFWMFGGPSDLLAKAAASGLPKNPFAEFGLTSNFITMTLLSFCAIILLPRQFHVSVVENYGEQEVARARWMFPLYLVAINIFVAPIALAGLVVFPNGTMNGDLFVLSLPFAGGSFGLTIFALIGGLSAATAMVIVESVALAIMVSNHLVVPLVLRRQASLDAHAGNVGRSLLRVRRVTILIVLLLAYLYTRLAGDAQLAAIGLLSFTAVAQFAPAFFGGLIWRRGTARGAIGGIVAGFCIWVYTLLLPSIADTGLIGAQFLAEGPFGIALLRPQSLFGADLPPLVNGVAWSLTVNLLVYALMSIARQPSAIERLQADVFVPSAITPIAPNFRLWRSSITVGDLMATVGQYLGEQRGKGAFEQLAQEHDIDLDPVAPADFRLLRHAEHLIASTIGAASARQVLSLMLRKRTLTASAALRLLDDAQAAIHFNREILQSALDHVRQGLAVFNREHDLICANRKFGELLDLPPRLTQLGTGLAEILQAVGERHAAPASAMPAFVDDRLKRYLSTSDVFLERMPGRNLVLEVRANAMPDAGYVITFTDITPSVEAAEALERANATLEKRVHERTEELTRLNTELARAKSTAEDANLSKTRFLAAASHDILQPLNAARLYTTSLVERTAGDTTRLAGNIDESLEAIEDIIGALLDISRLDAGAMKASLTTFSIGELLRTLENEFAPAAAARVLDLAVVPCSLPVRSDRVLLRRLLQNLISNAIKYTPKGRVLVGCRREGNMLSVHVYDTGVGIPAEKRKDIFKEFHRLDQGARIARGLGLGLSIVDRIARVLDHDIFVTDTNGGGAHFTVRVPVDESASRTLTEPAPRHPVTGDLVGMTVLCVDNEPSILEGMRVLLEGWGARVLTAQEPDAAMVALAEAKTQVTGLIVDYHLDQGNGIDAINALREKLGLAVPAILATADRSQSVREHAAARGIPVFNKPVRPAALRALLGQWRMMAERAAE